jgi:hypothetical protein
MGWLLSRLLSCNRPGSLLVDVGIVNSRPPPVINRRSRRFNAEHGEGGERALRKDTGSNAGRSSVARVGRIWNKAERASTGVR